MFSSLRSWCRIPVQIHTYTGTSVSGDASFSEPVTYGGYPVEQMEQITDKKGTEYISTMRVYFPESVAVTEKDMLSLPGDSRVYEIRKVTSFYDGNTGKCDLRVVYL